ncbi:unnamed protein product [Lymnaea stagnalis]|uniref:Tim10-like domain-containing protein n=1 Tax=Lymnaea stagnalis TaxID=6523 RepID=A0AAV2HSH9_LYMST
MANTLANEAHQRSLKDFLTLYNTITEYCFSKCISNFNERSPSVNETSCVETCTDNYVQYNQRFMFNFVDHQERRKRDLESAAVEAANKEAAVAQDAQTLELSVAQEQNIQQAAQLLESMSSSPANSEFSVETRTGSTDHPYQASHQSQLSVDSPKNSASNT